MQLEEEQIILKQKCAVCNQVIENESPECRCTQAKLCIDTNLEAGVRLTVAPEASDNQAELPEQMEPGLPRLGERYDVLSLIGNGGMATVYKIFDKTLGKTFAAKVMSAELSAEPLAVRRFSDEAEAASAMTHGNIAAVYSHGLTESNVPFLCMDYLEGETLADRIQSQGKLESHQALNIFQQICEALIHAHMKGIIHRDLKPSNIFLTKNEHDAEVIKLVDFGIAKLQYREEDSTKLTQTGALIGSPFYMSPEQCRGDVQDARSDIYALGCVMYQVLKGQPPFCDTNSVKIILQHVKQQPPAFEDSLDDSGLARALQACILRCLEKDPAKRYQSADELLAQLHSLEYTGPSQVVATEARPAPVRRLFASVVDALVIVFISCVIGYVCFGAAFQPLAKLIHFPSWQIAMLRDYTQFMAPLTDFSTTTVYLSILVLPSMFASMFLLALSFPFYGSYGQALVLPLYPLLYLLYCALCECSPLQGTFGKRLLGLVVVDKNGKRISLVRSIKRSLSKWIAPFVVLIQLATRPICREYKSPARNVLATYWRLFKYYPTDAITEAYVVLNAQGLLSVSRAKYIPNWSLSELKVMRRRWLNASISFAFTFVFGLVLLWIMAPGSLVWMAPSFVVLSLLPFVLLELRIRNAESRQSKQHSSPSHTSNK